MKENLIKKERNAKETIALVTGMFANIQDSLKDDRVRYRIFEDSYDAKKVLYFQMLEKSEFVNYKVVEIQDKDIVTFKLFLQTFGDDKLICEHTITDRYKLSIKHQTDINISKETDIKSKEDKKEYQEDIFRIFRMFKRIDEYFMLGYFIGNGAVYPLLEKSPGEFLNLCDKVWRQISPIYPSQASVIGTDMGTVLSEFHKLVDITLAKTISEVSSQSSDTFTSYIHLLRDTLITKFPELSSDNITEDLYLDTMSYRRLIEFAVDYVTTQVDAMLSSCKDVKKLRENYIRLNNLFKITKQAAEQAEFIIYESESVDEKLKEVCDYIDKKSKTMTLLLEKFIEAITHFNLNISNGKIKAEMDKSDDNFIEYTLKIFSDNMRKIQEDPTKDTFKKDMKMLMSLAERIVVANHENSKITGFTNDVPASIVSIRLRSIAQENKLKENKEDIKMDKEKDIFTPIDWEKEIGTSINLVTQIDWEKEFEKSSEELLKRAYCCKELKPTSLYPSYVNVIERLNCYDEHLMMLQPLDAKKSATKVIAHIVTHMSNAPISKDIVVESFVDQFCNINVNIYDNSGESPKTLVTRTYAHDEYTVTELGCGYAVGIYSIKYNKNESKDYYIPYKKKC